MSTDNIFRMHVGFQSLDTIVDNKCDLTERKREVCTKGREFPNQQDKQQVFAGSEQRSWKTAISQLLELSDPFTGSKRERRAVHPPASTRARTEGDPNTGAAASTTPTKGFSCWKRGTRVVGKGLLDEGGRDRTRGEEAWVCCWRG